MKKEIRTVCYDEELGLEAYRFEGIVQPFPNHFHPYYVMGFVEKGERCLVCRNREYLVREGDILLFQPGDSHACVQNDEGTLDYRALNISGETMRALAEDVTGEQEMPGFLENVIHDRELSGYLRKLHQLIMNGSREFEKEETLLMLISLLISRYSRPFQNCVPVYNEEIEKTCIFIQEHYAEHLYLDQICDCAGLSKSTLLRAFTKAKGVTPYRYLQSIRVNEAKKLLEQGKTPVDAAMQTGFSDQSHFTNAFHMFIGLSPGVYRDIFQERKEKQHEK